MESSWWHEQRLADIESSLRRIERRQTHTPAWAKRLEQGMADLVTALGDLTAADNAVVAELQKLADEVRNAPNTQAAADAIEAEAQRLQAAVASAEQPPTP